jgi:hypothetical protein
MAHASALPNAMEHIHFRPSSRSWFLTDQNWTRGTGISGLEPFADPLCQNNPPLLF